MKKLILTILSVVALANFTHLHAQAVKAEYVEAELVAEYNSIKPGQVVPMALRLSMDPEWHTYWKNPGDAGLPTTLSWELPAGFEASEFKWPYPERIVTPPLIAYGYSEEIFLLFDLKTPDDLQVGRDITLKATASWLVCNNICLPGEAALEITLPVKSETPSVDKKWLQAFVDTRAKLPIKNSGWAIEASVVDTQLVIQATPPNGLQVDLQELEFCPYEEGAIDNSVSPLFNKKDGAYRLTFRLSNSLEEPVSRVSGVLINPEGWRGSDSEKAMEFDVAISESLSTGQGAAGETGLFFALIFSFIGGLILNLMPCVLPVLSIKILGFVNQAKEKDSQPWKHGAAFTFGVLLSFWILAGTLIALRAGGEQLGWGFQLQSPTFIVVLSAIIFLFGLSLFGVFEIGTSMTSVGGRMDRGSGLGGSFWSGVAATVVATPCTAPFMGSALGYALTQPVWAAMLIFTFLGFGMSAPYLILASSPKLLKFVPKPGRWMESFKQFMGFFMMATVVWLAWVLGNQTGVDGIAVLLFALLFIGVAGWLYGRWATPVAAPKIRRIATTIAFLFTIAGIYFGIANTQDLAPSSMNSVVSGEVKWQPYSDARLAELQQNQQPVLIDFTASWCLSCKVNERVAFTEAVGKKIEELGIVPLKADWTNRDPVIAQALER
ncbi:MAG: thioredoxin family protein, partial [Deferribacteres bacterium]|nr:thioredoxin family protein [Deferribacteres bacterium]